MSSRVKIRGTLRASGKSSKKHMPCSVGNSAGNSGRSIVGYTIQPTKLTTPPARHLSKQSRIPGAQSARCAPQRSATAMARPSSWTSTACHRRWQLRPHVSPTQRLVPACAAIRHVDDIRRSSGIRAIRVLSTTDPSPNFAMRGYEGEHVTLELGVKLLADIGLVGASNVGTTTLLRALTTGRARSTVAG